MKLTKKRIDLLVYAAFYNTRAITKSEFDMLALEGKFIKNSLVMMVETKLEAYAVADYYKRVEKCKTAIMINEIDDDYIVLLFPVPKEYKHLKKQS